MKDLRFIEKQRRDETFTLLNWFFNLNEIETRVRSYIKSIGTRESHRGVTTHSNCWIIKATEIVYKL